MRRKFWVVAVICIVISAPVVAQDGDALTYDESWARNAAPNMVEKLLGRGMFAEAREVMAMADLIEERAAHRRQMGERPSMDTIFARSCAVVIDDLYRGAYAEGSHNYAAGILDGFVEWQDATRIASGASPGHQIEAFCLANPSITVGDLSEHIPIQ